MTSASSATNQTIGKMRSQKTTSSSTIATTSRSSPQNNVEIDQQRQSPNWSKIQMLKQRKSDLEKLLNEKNFLLHQIRRQEQQIIAGDFNHDFNNHINNNATLRRKIGTSFKMPNKNCYTNKEQLGGSVGDVEKKVRQEIFNATYKLANDQNTSKPIRRLHISEYDAAQQKLIAFNHGVNILKKQHQRPPIPPQAEPSAAITLNLTKTPSVGGEQNTTMKQCHSATTAATTLLDPNLSNNNKYGSSNSLSNYYTSERRNSIKSMQRQNSPKQQQYDDRSPTMLLKTHHRSDYDLANRLLILTPQNLYDNGETVLLNNNNNVDNGYYNSNNMKFRTSPISNNNSSDVSNRLSTATTTNVLETINCYPTQQLYDNGETVLLNNNNIIDSGYYNNNNMKFKTSPISSNNSSDVSNRLSTVMTTMDTINYYSPQQLHQQQPLPQQQHQLQQHQYDDAAALFLAQRAYSSGGREYLYGDSIDSISISPSTGAMSTVDHQQTGLGGYWRTLGNERIWCTVDTSYDCGSSIQQAGKLKKANTIATTPTESLLLGNFDIISGKDELGDKISISSMNSENNKKQKEKHWLETSLDGPLIKTKHQSSASSLSPTHHHNQSHPIQHHHHYNTATVQNHTHKHNSPIYYRDRTKLSSQSVSNTAYHIPKLDDQQYLSNLTSMLHNSSSSGPIIIGETSSNQMNYHHHYHQNMKQQKSPTPPIITIQQHKSQSSPQPTIPIDSSITSSSSPPPPPIPPQSSSSMLLKQQQSHQHNHHHHQQQYQSVAINPRSPIIANLAHHDSIRIESAKNMTVIQPAVFMPYKEITKPFEMSDFYKYSTKFRQKEKQQHQQQVEVEQ